MSEDDLREILSASRPTPVMFLSGGQPMGSSQQENANRAWAALGQKMGFEPMTVRPVSGKGQRFFTAIPSETLDQRADRLAAEAETKRKAEVETLQAEITERQERLQKLENRN